MQTSADIVLSPADAISAAGAADSVALNVSRRLRATARDYVSLAKPRIIVLLLITEVATMIIAARGIPSLALLFWAALGGALASGGSGAINCWYDRDIDRVMARTCRRPLPSGRIVPWRALTFGASLILASVGVFALAVNTLAAALALGGALFYVFIYTMLLKRRTPLNIVIGGAAGAFPPLVGWAAVQGNIAWPAFVLFAVVFLWTPPHFWSLALLLRRDYRNASVPMLPGIIGTARTHRRILLYLVALITVSLLPGLALGAGYTAGAAVLGGVYLALALWARAKASSGAAALLFHYSLAYLALIFVVGAVAAVVLGLDGERRQRLARLCRSLRCIRHALRITGKPGSARSRASWRSASAFRRDFAASTCHDRRNFSATTTGSAEPEERRSTNPNSNPSGTSSTNIASSSSQRIPISAMVYSITGRNSSSDQQWTWIDRWRCSSNCSRSCSGVHDGSQPSVMRRKSSMCSSLTTVTRS